MNSPFSCVLSLPGPADAVLLHPATGQHTVGVGVVLDAVALLVAPLVLLVGIVEVHVAGELLAEAEGSAAFRLVLGLDELGLDDGMFMAPRVREVHILEVHRLKAVLPTWSV